MKELDTTTARHLATIIANQEEIIKMLAEVMGKEEFANADLIYKERIATAKTKIPMYVNDFLNDYRAEAAKGQGRG